MLQEPLFFNGWTINTVMIALVQAGGGLLVAATLKYADAVLKTLATSGAIVLSAVLGWVLFGAQLDIFVTIGCVCTILAIFNYTVRIDVLLSCWAGWRRVVVNLTLRCFLSPYLLQLDAST